MQLILSGMVNICQLVAVFPTFAYLDKVGRRTMAIWGAVAMAVPHLIVAGLMGEYGSDWDSHKVAGWWCVGLICKMFIPYYWFWNLTRWQMHTSWRMVSHTDH